MFHTSFLRLKENVANEWILIRIFLACGVALFTVVPSAYLSTMGVDETLIGIIFSIINILVFFSTFFFSYFLEKINQMMSFILTVIVSMLIYLSFSFYENSYFFIFLFALLGVIAKFRMSIEEIQFKDNIKEDDFLSKRSLLMAILNIFWIIMPFLGGIILANYGFNYIFYITASLFFFSLIISFFLKIKSDVKVRDKYDKNIWENISFFVKRKHLVYSFILSLSLRFWYTFVFVFIPIYIIKNGLPKEYIGFLISATQLPLIFVQLKIGYFVKTIGMKKIFITTYFMIFLVCVLSYIYGNIMLIGILLFISGFFVAFLEVLPEVYYFKQVNKIEEEKTYPIFSDGATLGAIVGNIVLGLVLLFISSLELFLFVGFIMLIFGLMSFKLEDYRK